MPSKSPTVEVNPALLIWARESVAATVDDVAARLRISVETVKKWEAGEESPSLRELEALAAFCKRPLAAFLLAQPPHETPLPDDFRTLPGKPPAALSRKARIIIRRAMRLQRLAAGLMSEMALPASQRMVGVSLSSSAEDVACGERARVGIPVEQQTRWRNNYEAFRAWRRALERLNIFVFGFPMSMDEARGFSLTEADPPVIVVNSSDIITARIFTLFHEYAHILLHAGGLCLHEEARITEHLPIESFCNRFAGHFLVPRDSLLGDVRLRGCSEPAALTDADLRAIASRFKVSRYVVWRRLSETLPIPKRAYWDRVERWLAVPLPPRKKVRAPSRAERCLRQRGRKFASLVFEAKGQNLVTYRDALDYLGVWPQDVGNIETLLRGGRVK
jgi:Zn-dependent peptidase ImmA (M78 family)